MHALEGQSSGIKLGPHKLGPYKVLVVQLDNLTSIYTTKRSSPKV